jgi:hypothetical protein
MDILQAYLRLKSAALVFKDTLVKMWPDMVDAMEPAISSFVKLSHFMGVAMDMDPDSNLKGWDKWGVMMAKIVGGVGILFVKMVAMALKMMNVLARQMVSANMLSTDEYARMMGAPDQFFKLDEDVRDELVRNGTFSEKVQRAGGNPFGGPAERVHTDPTQLEGVYQENVAPALAWAQGIQRGNQAKVDEILDGLKGIGGPRGPIQTVPPAQAYASLGGAQRQIVDEAVLDNKISEAEFKALADAIGKVFAEQLRANPIAFKIDREAMASEVEEGANASWEEAS